MHSSFEEFAEEVKEPKDPEPIEDIEQFKNKENIVFSSPDVQNWLFQNYGPTVSSRFYSFQMALGILAQTRDDVMIVETGCQRMADDYGAGMSTTIFAEYVSRYGGEIVSIDNNLRHLTICANLIQNFKKHITLVHGDSLETLKRMTGEVDLLYLDSLDFSLDNPKEQRRSQEHALKEIQSGLHLVSRIGSLVMFDDNQLENGGKPTLAKRWLADQGWICLFDYQQSLWTNGFALPIWRH